MIDEEAKAKAMTMLASGHTYISIERATGINFTTVRSWAIKRDLGIKSLSETRVSCRHDSGQLHEIAERGDGWDTAMGADLLRYKFTDFPKYILVIKNEKG